MTDCCGTGAAAAAAGAAVAVAATVSDEWARQSRKTDGRAEKDWAREWQGDGEEYGIYGEREREEKKKLKAKLNGRPLLLIFARRHTPSRFCLLHLSSGQQNYCLKATSNLS